MTQENPLNLNLTINLGPRQNLPESSNLPPDIFDNPQQYDADIPYWGRTVELVNKFIDTRPNKRAPLVNQFVRPFFRDFTALGSIFENIEFIEQTRSGTDVPSLKRELLNCLESNVFFTKPSDWRPEKIEELAKLAENAKTNYVATRLETALFKIPQTIEEAVDLHYNAAWAMVTTEDKAVREHLFSILNLETHVISEHSLGPLFVMMGTSLGNERTKLKAHSIIRAVHFTAGYIETLETGVLSVNTDRSNQSFQKINQTARQPKVHLSNSAYGRYVKELNRYVRRHLGSSIDFLKGIQAFTGLKPAFTAPEPDDLKLDGENYIDRMESFRNKWEKFGLNDVVPENVKNIYLNEPLAEQTINSFFPQMARTYLEDSVQATINDGGVLLTPKALQFPNGYLMKIVDYDPIESEEQRNAIVREVYETIASGQNQNPKRTLAVSFERIFEAVDLLSSVTQAFDRDGKIYFFLSKVKFEEEVGRLSSVLEFHRPLISLEQIGQIEKANDQLRTAINQGFTRGVGKRGHQVLISDHALKQMGYEKILFKDAGEGKILTTVTIEGQEYQLTMDKNGQLILGGDVIKFNNHQDQVWLELLVLSHLEKVMCTEEKEEVLKDEMVGGNKQYEIYRRQTIKRTDYLRQLPDGEHYTENAFLNCLRKSTLPMNNLHIINTRRTEIGLRPVTYVSGVDEVDITDAAPIKVSYKNASKNIREVIPLGQVSDEELARVEKEILEDLQLP